MSQRNRPTDIVQMMPRQERRAHAHSEKHRMRVELQYVAQTVSAGVEPEDVHEPGSAWRPTHRHDSEIAKSKLANRDRMKRHWKTKMWKRRTQLRMERIRALQMVRENPGLAGY